jgi:hypothetical protein
MAEVALNNDGTFLVASEFGPLEWEIMKNKYSVGDFLMPCCKALAIPKTSPNRLPFFSHYSDECASAPETIWHLQVKEALVKELKKRSIQAKDEVSCVSESGKWKADVYFEHSDRAVVFEAQHSYQHLRDYFRRQERYKESAVECYWILYKPRFLTVTKSIAKHRLKEEFGNKFPKDKEIGAGLGQISSLPIVWFEPDVARPVKAPGGFSTDVDLWIDSVLDGSFRYFSGGWRIY